MGEEAARFLYGQRVSEDVLEQWKTNLGSDAPKYIERLPNVIRVHDECEAPCFIGVKLPGGKMGDYRSFELNTEEIKKQFNEILNTVPDFVKASLKGIPGFFVVPYHT